MAPIKAPGKRVAVVGSDLAALSTVYNLWKQTDGRANIHMFEEGHDLAANARMVKLRDGGEVSLDPLVLSTSAHPNLAKFLKELGMELEKTDHSVSIQNSFVSYITGSVFLSLILALLTSPLKAFKLLWSIWAFYIHAWSYIAEVESEKESRLTLEALCRKKGMSAATTEGFVVPMVQSMFPCSKEACLKLDAYRVLKVMSKHQMLTFWKRTWYKSLSGSVGYTKAVLDKCKPTVHMNTPIQNLTLSNNGKWTINKSPKLEFDAVVFATIPKQQWLKMEHAGQEAMMMIELANQLQTNEQVLVFHNDTKRMPTNRDNWAFVNVTNDQTTFWENKGQAAQGIGSDVFLTITPRDSVSKLTISKEKYLHEPLVMEGIQLTEKNYVLGEKIGELQGSSGLYIGAALNPLGTHEDSYKAGLKVANLMQGNIYRKPLDCKDREDVTLVGILKRSLECIPVGIFKWYARNIVHKSSIGVLFPNHDMIYVEGKYKGEPMVLVQVENFMFVPFAFLFHELGWVESLVRRLIAPDNMSLLCYLQMYNFPYTKTWYHRLFSYVKPTPRSLFDNYDHINDFFGCILDESKTFSMALFKNETDTLAQAQYQKLDRIVDHLDVDENSHVLEIGAGWGSFACRLAQRKGCKVAAVTTSPIEPIKVMAKDMNLEDKVTADHVDFLDVPKHFPGKKFDAIVLIEVIEENYGRRYERYFKVLSDHLKDGGQVMIQLTLAFHDYERTGPDTLKEVTFPGGTLPTLGELCHIAAQQDLALVDTYLMNVNYHHTARRWLENFTKRTKAMGKDCPFDEEFFYSVIVYLQCAPGMMNSNAVNSYQLIFKKNTFCVTGLL